MALVESKRTINLVCVRNTNELVSEWATRRVFERPGAMDRICRSSRSKLFRNAGFDDLRARRSTAYELRHRLPNAF